MLRGPFGAAPGKCVFPIFALEQTPRPHRLRIVIIEATGVDAVVLGIGTWVIKRMDAAIPAECVLRHAGVEGVGAQRIGATENFESLIRHRQMEDALLDADRAVAFADDALVQIDLDAKPHAPAMATTFVTLEHGSPPSPAARLTAPRRPENPDKPLLFRLAVPCAPSSLVLSIGLHPATSAACRPDGTCRRRSRPYSRPHRRPVWQNPQSSRRGRCRH